MRNFCQPWVRGDAKLRVVERHADVQVNVLRKAVRRKPYFLAFTFALCLFMSWVSAQAGFYTVTRGDTLYAIAQRFDTTVAVLEQLNTLPNTSLQIGQQLRVPAQALAAGGSSFELETSTAQIQRHQVALGETLAAIAADYGVSEAAIMAVNREFEAGVPSGAVLRIPPAGGVLVTVTQETKLLSLALAHGLSPAELVHVNDLQGLSDISAGQLIYVPPAVTASPAKRPADAAALPLEQRQQMTAGLPANEPSMGYIWPLAVRGRISSPFGFRNISVGGNRYHGGVDIAAPTGTVVRAARSGTVTRSGWTGAYGYAIYLNHEDGSQTRYAHLSGLLVAVGQTVSQGAAIGLVGTTGASTGPHLHFEIRFGGRAVNPLPYLTADVAALSAGR